MPKTSMLTSALILLCLFATTGLVQAGDKPTHLPIGDEKRRTLQAPVTLDAITDTRDMAVLSPSELIRRLGSTRILLVGESHTSEEFHRVQEIVIRELHRAGRQVIVGLEMKPTDAQGSLDRWVAGELSEEQFLEEGAWYTHWGYAWEYYRPIFQLARRSGIPMRGLNVPRELVSQVRKEGFESLGETDRRRLPPEIQPSDDSFARLFMSYFDDDSGMHALEGEMLEGFLSAQSAWDASMAWSAVQVAKAHPEAIVVVLIGSGHVAYGYGVERQAQPWTEAEISTLIPVATSSDGEPVESVTASYADFLWGVLEEPFPRFPSLGVSTRATDDGSRTVLFVDDESPAASLDLQPGDVLHSIDGVEIQGPEILRRIIGTKLWGDTVSLEWSRGDQKLTGLVKLRREVEVGEDDPPAQVSEPVSDSTN